MLYHPGRSALVHFGEPSLRHAVCLYTSTFSSFCGTSPTSHTVLMHVTLTRATRTAQPITLVGNYPFGANNTVTYLLTKGKNLVQAFIGKNVDKMIIYC
jgi:hypothetical protein